MNMFDVEYSRKSRGKITDSIGVVVRRFFTSFLFLVLFVGNLFCNVRAYFNSPEFGHNLRDIIISYINQAVDNISISAYSFDDTDIANALIRANQRGVKIRIVVDSDYWNSLIDYLDSQPNINVFNDLKKKGYARHSRQHHSKFIVIDYSILSSPVRNTVITGSFNFTVSSSYKQYNNIVVIEDNVDVANMYIQEFNEEWGGGQFEFNPELSRFGKQKKDPPPYQHITDNIEVYFSYSDVNKIENKLCDLIENSSNVFICMYAFSTNSKLFDVIYNLPSDRLVYGIFDGGQAFGQYSAFKYLASKHPDRFVIDYEYKILHNKYIIINYSEDYENTIVITGSYNLSKNSEENNEENVIIIKGLPEISKKFMRDFLYHFSKTGRSIEFVSYPMFYPTNLISFGNSTNTLFGKNLSNVVSIAFSNISGVYPCVIISNTGDSITFLVPYVFGVFDVIVTTRSGDSFVIPIDFVVLLMERNLLVVNNGEKYFSLDNPVRILLFSSNEQEISYVRIIVDNKVEFLPLRKKGMFFEGNFYLDSFGINFRDGMEVVFNYGDIFITNYVVLPTFRYYIDRPDKLFKNHYYSINVKVFGSMGRNMKVSANGNIPLSIYEDGSITFFTGNNDIVEIFITVEDDLGYSYSEMIQMKVFDNEGISVYPTILPKGEKIFVDGFFDKIEVVDKDYNRVSFVLGEDELGRRYLIPNVLKNSQILFLVFYVGNSKVVKKVIVK